MSYRAVEVTTRYATSVDTLQEAWEFIMDALSKVGEDPQIKISPVWSRDWNETDDKAPWPRHFSVVVSGMIEEK